jgi:hypothetical protein
MIVMTTESDVTGTCISEIEMRHILDPMDTDDGPFQHLADGTPPVSTEPARETAPVVVS